MYLRHVELGNAHPWQTRRYCPEPGMDGLRKAAPCLCTRGVDRQADVFWRASPLWVDSFVPLLRPVKRCCQQRCFVRARQQSGPRSGRIRTHKARTWTRSGDASAVSCDAVRSRADPANFSANGPDSEPRHPSLVPRPTPSSVRLNPARFPGGATRSVARCEDIFFNSGMAPLRRIDLGESSSNSQSSM